ncbi:MAG: hypothetical protein IH602_10575 [Bryobacteraceae bacterium]|nr:hypothetical protein [Bryobacteraceae bacterium]
MSKNVMACTRESEAVRALHSGSMADELREHIAGCESCGEALALAAAFAGEMAPVEAPDAGLMWHKMELRRRRERAEAAMRPAMVAERVAAVLMFVCAAVAVPWLTEMSAALALTAVAGVTVLGLSAASVYWLASPKR